MKHIVSFLAALFLSSPLLAAKIPVRTHELLSDVYTIDKVYRSMEGPGSIHKVLLGNITEPELLWLVGVRTEMVMEDGKTPQLPELMCHVNVDYDAVKHQELFATKHSIGTRVVTLSQGMTEARVPEGFAFPVASNEPLVVFTQVLNHNIQEPNNMRVRHRVTFEYIRDRDLTAPMKPLLNIGASGMMPVEDEATHEHSLASAGTATHEAHGTSCLLTSRAANAVPGSDYTDPAGRKMTGHWAVPPGRQVNVTDVSWFMALPFDSKLHYAAAHLHPFAESIALRDATTGKTLFVSKTKNPKDKVGLDHVDAFTSIEGVPLVKKHKYELVSVYNNTTPQTHDSMASVFLGIEDKQFVKPSGAELARREEEMYDRVTPETATIRTSAGDLGFFLLNDLAPKTAKQFARLVRKGWLNGARVAAVEVNGASTRIAFTRKLTPEMQAALKKLPVEGTNQHAAATLSYCPGNSSEEFTFDVMVGVDPTRDGRCTVFGRLGPGSDVVVDIMKRPRDGFSRPIDHIEVTGTELNGAPSTPTRASM